MVCQACLDDWKEIDFGHSRIKPTTKQVVETGMLKHMCEKIKRPEQESLCHKLMNPCKVVGERQCWAYFWATF